MSHRLETVPETGSTNDDILARARDGAAEGLWIRADRQTRGRGRLGRGWASPDGNLSASTLVRLRPDDPPAPNLAFVAAVALREAVAPHIRPAQALLKWPNDLVVAGAKLSGILLERAGDAVVAGFGVNLATRPPALDRPTTSIADLAATAPTADALLNDLATAFAHWLARWRHEGFAPVRARWLDHAHPPGTALRVHAATGPIEGAFEGIDTDGALLLRVAGTLTTVHAGDVFLI